MEEFLVKNGRIFSQCKQKMEAFSTKVSKDGSFFGQSEQKMEEFWSK
jgi:hypothetical protein